MVVHHQVQVAHILECILQGCYPRAVCNSHDFPLFFEKCLLDNNRSGVWEGVKLVYGPRPYPPLSWSKPWPWPNPYPSSSMWHATKQGQWELWNVPWTSCAIFSTHFWKLWGKRNHFYFITKPCSNWTQFSIIHDYPTGISFHDKGEGQG